MGRPSSVLIGVLVFLLVIGCTEEFFPPGLYDYQVARLLTADDNKLWVVTSNIVNGQAQPIASCPDSLFLLFSADGDSIEISSLVRNCSQAGLFDTTLVGKALPSSLGDVFTDSLVLKDANPWIVRSVTSQFSDIFYSQNGNDINLFLESN